MVQLQNCPIWYRSIRTRCLYVTKFIKSYTQNAVRLDESASKVAKVWMCVSCRVWAGLCQICQQTRQISMWSAWSGWWSDLDVLVITAFTCRVKIWYKHSEKKPEEQQVQMYLTGLGWYASFLSWLISLLQKQVTNTFFLWNPKPEVPRRQTMLARWGWLLWCTFNSVILDTSNIYFGLCHKSWYQQPLSLWNPQPEVTGTSTKQPATPNWLTPVNAMLPLTGSPPSVRCCYSLQCRNVDTEARCDRGSTLTGNAEAEQHQAAIISPLDWETAVDRISRSSIDEPAETLKLQKGSS